MRRTTLSLAGAILVGAPSFALAQQVVQPPTPVINRAGGFPGTGFGAAGAGAGSTSTTSATTSSATPINRARSPAMISGTQHIGAGTGGMGLGMGNATGGVRDNAIGAGSGGLNDLSSRGNLTGGVIGGGAFDAPVGGFKEFNQGINTGGVQGSAIGAGTGGLQDLNTLGASTGGTKEGNNAPRYRVVQ